MCAIAAYHVLGLYDLLRCWLLMNNVELPLLAMTIGLYHAVAGRLCDWIRRCLRPYLHNSDRDWVRALILSSGGIVRNTCWLYIALDLNITVLGY